MTCSVGTPCEHALAFSAEPVARDATAGEQEEGQDGGGGDRDLGYPASVSFDNDMHRALDDLALTMKQPHDWTYS